MNSRIWHAAAIALCVFGAFGGPQVGSAQAPSANALAIVGGTIVDGTGAPPRPDMTIIVAGDRIARIGPSATTPPPAGSQVIQAAGKYVIPGLWESHVHLREFQTELLITHGITSVIDWGSDPVSWVVAQKEGVAKGRLYGPRVFTSLDFISERGNPAPETVRRQVREYKAMGADKIDVGFGLRKEALLAVIDEANKLGLPTSGYPAYARAAIEAGISALKHTYPLGAAMASDPDKFFQEQTTKPARDARDFLLGDNYQELARLMAAKKVAWVTTFGKDFKVMLDRRDEYELENYRLLANPELQYLPVENLLMQLTNDHPTGLALVVSGRIGTVDRTSADWQLYRNAYKNLLGFTKAFADAGGHVVPGTAPHSFVLPGISLHQELQLIVDAGLTPMQALQGATLYAAQYIRADKDLGTIAPGKLADIVILTANPLQNIRNTRTVETVIQGGRVLPRGYHRNYVNPIPRVTRVGVGTTTVRVPGEGYGSPQLDSISPASALEGSKDVMLTIRGRGFVPVSSAYFERAPLETTFVSPAELKAVVPGRLVATAGSYRVQVWTPQPGGGRSDSVPFLVKF